LTLADVTAVYGGGTTAFSPDQKHMAVLTEVATTSFSCLDSRLSKPALMTPGGDLGEFVLALATYYQERDPTGSTGRPSQESVNAMLLKYLGMLPPSRPVVLCTDEAAIAHLEAVLPAENLDLSSPPMQAQQAGLLQKLTQPDSQGDSHFRLMLKQPQWYQLDEYLVPMVLKAFYTNLWRQEQDPHSPLHGSHKLKLEVLPRLEPTDANQAQAFLEVMSSEACQKSGMAPMMVPRDANGRSVLISHLDAVSQRREELASFLARIANATPRKLDKERLHERLDRHGWLALETTGSRIAADLPFYTLSYS
jgi:hypothetical protein